MSELLIETREHVRFLTMNRPDKRNALNNTLTAALIEALRAAELDESVRSIVLTGAGRAFCAGADLSEFEHLTPDQQPLLEHRAELTMNLHGLFSRLSKPVVTAINGAAGRRRRPRACRRRRGHGERRHPRLSGTQAGIVAAVVMANLVRQASRKAAFELVATGPGRAARALALGLVNRITASDQLMAEAMGMAQKFAAFDGAAMAATKQLFYRMLDLPFEQALEEGRDVNKRMRAFRNG